MSLSGYCSSTIYGESICPVKLLSSARRVRRWDTVRPSGSSVLIPTGDVEQKPSSIASVDQGDWLLISSVLYSVEGYNLAGVRLSRE